MFWFRIDRPSRLAVALAVLGIAAPWRPVAAQSSPETAVRATALAMPRAIDHADWDGFIELFTDDAIMYFPFRSSRANGRQEIAAVMKPIFERSAQREERPLFGFTPEDVSVRMLGVDAAVVTWIMPRATDVARRTAVLRRVGDGSWKICLVHADNVVI